MIFFVMGVSGSGKTTIGKLLAERLRAPFFDGDDFHSASNKSKMAAGHPLDDTDREPWLAALNQLAHDLDARGESVVIACSALKQRYRDLLVRGIGLESVHFVLLEGSRALIAERLAGRQHEFMNPGLLDTQFAILEVPKDAHRFINDRPPAEVVDQILL